MQTREESIERIKGLFNITVTSFEQNGDVDFKALGENVERVLDQGFDDPLIGVTYGEFSILEKQKRANSVKAVVEQVAADSDARVTLA